MRYAEIAILLVPVGLLVAWLAGVRGLSSRGTVAALLLLALTGAALVWFGEARDVHGRYAPARMQDGHVVQGHAG